MVFNPGETFLFLVSYMLKDEVTVLDEDRRKIGNRNVNRKVVIHIHYFGKFDLFRESIDRGDQSRPW